MLLLLLGIALLALPALAQDAPPTVRLSQSELGDVLVGPEAAAAAGIEGELGIIERADGLRQVTYNGMPLYFFAQDAAPGDTNGQGRGENWFVVAP
jgi:hypothetical protein